MFRAPPFSRLLTALLCCGLFGLNLGSVEAGNKEASTHELQFTNSSNAEIPYFVSIDKEKDSGKATAPVKRSNETQFYALLIAGIEVPEPVLRVQASVNPPACKVYEAAVEYVRNNGPPALWGTASISPLHLRSLNTLAICNSLFCAASAYSSDHFSLPARSLLRAGRNPRLLLNLRSTNVSLT
ncbi:hypothetical protein [Rariglobus hedericola]|uniref:hypothetical protein n=1 Tax=Rariglobus hedericola TaxID=2597822 RepID=UPI001EEFD534|nr:hypothetical protein [Rariglobus hedericola]